MNFKRFSTSDNQWHDIPYYQHKTATDTLTLPAALYPNDTSITVGLKGNEEHTGTPTPSNPVDVLGTGERTGNLFDGELLGGFYRNNQFSLDTSVSEVYKSIKVYLIAGTYTIGFENPVNIVRQILDGVYSENLDTDINTYTFTATTDAYYGISFRLSQSSQVPWDNSNIMFNSGSEPLPYEPHGYKIPISSAGQTTPVYLGEVQTERKIQKLVLTGEENWKLSSTIDIFYIDEILGAIRGDVLCTHFAGVDSFSGNNQITVSQSLRINIRTNYVSHNLTDWTNYLAQQYANGTPVTVWYVLATPQTTTVNEPLMKIGDYADSLTTSIPCTAGENTLDVQTTVQPSEVTAGFSGWHPVTDVHERENGQWD